MAMTKKKKEEEEEWEEEEEEEEEMWIVDSGKQNSYPLSHCWMQGQTAVVIVEISKQGWRFTQRTLNSNIEISLLLYSQ